MGRAGEKRAVEFLKEKGYKILEQNFKTHFGEIDVIVRDGEVVVFVEVKTRSDDRFGAPSEAVNYKKREKYFVVASEYLRNKGLLDSPSRFDVVEIENGKINHIIDAFCM